MAVISSTSRTTGPARAFRPRGLHIFMAVPALALYTLFFVYPLAQGIGLSLTDWNGIGRANFVGLDNFVRFFSDERAVTDVWNTLLFALGSAPLLNLVGLGYALLLNRAFRGREVARMVVYMPAIISPLVMGYIWYFILQPGRGFLARLFVNAEIFSATAGWFSDRSSALLVLVLVNVWQYAGMTMIVYLAGLQSIPSQLYEASRIDGAGKFATFRYVTLPMLYPSVQVNVITNIIGSLAVFDVVVALTDGGPGYATETLSLYIMRMVFGGSTGYSTAVAIVLFFIILVPVLLSLKLMRRKELVL